MVRMFHSPTCKNGLKLMQASNGLRLIDKRVNNCGCKHDDMLGRD